MRTGGTLMETPDLVPANQDDATVVLVVEDEFLVRLAIADELRSSGLTVVEAANATEAWLYLESGGRADIVFSDVQMPGAMDGVEFARRVRADYPAIPFILTSGNVPEESLGGMTPFVRKPYRFEEVKGIILEILRRNP